MNIHQNAPTVPSQTTVQPVSKGILLRKVIVLRKHPIVSRISLKWVMYAKNTATENVKHVTKQDMIAMNVPVSTKWIQEASVLLNQIRSR